VRAESQSMAAKIASLGRMTPMLATVFNSVRYAPPCNDAGMLSAWLLLQAMRSCKLGHRQASTMTNHNCANSTNQHGAPCLDR